MKAPPCRKGPKDVGVRRFALRLWNGMTLGAWLRLMKGNWGKVSAAHIPAVAGIFVTTGINQIRKWIGQVLIEPKVRRVEIRQPPVFILGHWRSGTTWLHQTMAADPAFAAPTMQACMTPECFLVGRRLLNPILRVLFPTGRPMDDVRIGMNAPEEDEHAILLSGAYTPYRNLLFPCEKPDGTAARTEDMPEAEADFWRQTWLAFLRRVQFANPGKRLLLKSPAHTMRIAEILRQFPEARFVHILRDPYQIFASAVATHRIMSASQSLQTCTLSDEDAARSVFDGFLRLHSAFHDQQHLIPDGHLITIRYEDMMADTPAVLRRIYEALELGDYDRVARHFEHAAEKSSGYQTNSFDLDPATVARINTRWHDYFERYGYAKLADGPGGTS